MPALDQMKMLINLARIDGRVAERERNYIINIGRANGLYPDQISPLFDQHHDMLIPENLKPDQKFEFILSMVQLMKIDERMYTEEIHFCSHIASRLGYDEQVMFDLLLHVKSANMGDDEVDHLKKLTTQYLKSKS
ncbi:MAG: hypothetical protein ACOYXT_27045 [Bacteroidota bacterium]